MWWMHAMVRVRLLLLVLTLVTVLGTVAGSHGPTSAWIDFVAGKIIVAVLRWINASNRSGSYAMSID
jgi:hypothetical protein